MPEMRSPRVQERDDILNWMVSEGQDPQDCAGMLSQAAVGVADGYITDGPGYAGRVISIVWSGDPSIHQVLIYQDGRLTDAGCDRAER
jgi:hypothetical protein